MAWFKKDPVKARKKQIFKWMETLCQPNENDVDIYIKDTSGQILAAIEVEGIKLNDNGRDHLWGTSYNSDLQIYPTAALLDFTKVKIQTGDDLYYKDWNIGGVRMSVPDVCTTYDEFLLHFEEVLIDLLVLDLNDVHKHVFNPDDLNSITAISEISLDRNLNHLEYMVNVYDIFSKTHNVSIEKFREKVVSKLRSILIAKFAHADSIPISFMEFLYSVNDLFPCMETLDDNVFVIDDGRLARPFIIKKSGDTFVRTSMLDEEYLRYDLAKKLTS